MSGLDEIEEQYKQYEIQKLAENRENLAQVKALRKKKDIIGKYTGTKPSSEEDIKEIQSLVCWSDIAYCCSTDNDCFWRNVALELLDISLEEYSKFKEECCRKYLHALIIKK